MKHSKLALLLVLLFGVVANAQDAPKLKQITRIYVDRLGDEESSDLVREKIKIRIVKSKRFTLVEDVENADAILTGSAGTQRRQVGSISSDGKGAVSGRENTVYTGVGALRLVLVKSKETVWVYEYKPGFFATRSASSSVADKVVDRLLKDAKEEEKPPSPGKKK
jgi:hypothetical protein